MKTIKHIDVANLPPIGERFVCRINPDGTLTQVTSKDDITEDSTLLELQLCVMKPKLIYTT